MAECTEKIKFACAHCGSRLSVSVDKTGRRGKCPHCQEPLIVPPPAPQVDAPAASPEPTLIDPLQDASLLDLSHLQAREDTQETIEELRERHLPSQPTEIPKRKLPWIIDIFLYPLSTAGLVALGIVVGGPLLLQAFAQLSLIASLAFGPMVVFWAIFIVFYWVALIVLCTYLNWYACECIRDSAVGGIRAADTVGRTPGLGEILLESWRVFLCAAVCTAPALIYATQTRQTDGVFLGLMGAAAFFLPMAIMAVVRFESIRVLNPILLIGSIFSTFLPYCALVPMCYTLLALLPLAVYLLVVKRVAGYLVLLAAYYVWLILAHLLGRFCWKYEERLNWDV